MQEATWSVVLPVKRLAAAKSRLRGALTGVPHEELALALALDTVAAVLACPVVAEAVVVTADPVAAAALAALGARTVAEPDPGGLNAALTHGAATVPAGRPVAALTADLPALRPAELAAALRAATSPAAARQPADTGQPAAVGRWFVPDADGTGTVLLAAADAATLHPRFGPGSADRHAASGARRIGGTGDTGTSGTGGAAWPTLRRDVDTADGLADAARLGLGRHTAALCRAGYRAGRRPETVG
ncbi:2-phospho-L-lactate guanylyltransferase [Solwaraspora sp. WMMA2101]|uniref:2-phospho-L-lactate guanylyltransferase n=1 Tax=Solwaraspora sp. WMMA2101 TaxID=3404124 RepID=UPI003B9478C1